MIWTASIITIFFTTRGCVTHLACLCHWSDQVYD